MAVTRKSVIVLGAGLSFTYHQLTQVESWTPLQSAKGVYLGQFVFRKRAVVRVLNLLAKQHEGSTPSEKVAIKPKFEGRDINES